MLSVQNLSKSYNDIPSLNTTSLEFEQGSTTAIIGPSGCGKSTLLKLMIRLITPDTGTVYFHQESLTDQNILQIRQKMGYVIQEGGLFPHLTAHENVSLLAKHLGWKDAQIEDRTQELAELTQLPTHLLNKFPLQLSGGQRQRISLMRALMLDPEILLLDEPMGALDPMVRFDLQRDLREIFQKLQKTVVLVTHDMGEAAYLADQIILMRAGSIVQQGTLDELMHTPSDDFVSQFIQAQRNPLDELQSIPSVS